jgi:flagellar protein FlbC
MVQGIQLVQTIAESTSQNTGPGTSGILESPSVSFETYLKNSSPSESYQYSGQEYQNSYQESSFTQDSSVQKNYQEDAYRANNQSSPSQSELDRGHESMKQEAVQKNNSDKAAENLNMADEESGRTQRELRNRRSQPAGNNPNKADPAERIQGRLFKVEKKSDSSGKNELKELDRLFSQAIRGLVREQEAKETSKKSDDVPKLLALDEQGDSSVEIDEGDSELLVSTSQQDKAAERLKEQSEDLLVQEVGDGKHIQDSESAAIKESQNKHPQSQKAQGIEVHGNESHEAEQKAKVMVIDARSHSPSGEQAESVEGAKPQGEGSFGSNLDSNNGNAMQFQESELSFNGKTQAPGAARQSASFSEVLSKNLKDQGHDQIVKNAKILLKNQGSGEIRLILKPERLGEVRIRLELQDNRIAGRILVENNTVRQAFNSSLQELHQAFADAGYDAGSLDVQVGGEHAEEQEQPKPNRHVIEELMDSVPELQWRESEALNLLV